LISICSSKCSGGAISRHGADRGCGLKVCAAKGIKFDAQLDVRLPTSACFSNPHAGHTSPTGPVILPLLWGTHIGFALGLAA
jgi:hypothetical protein